MKCEKNIYKNWLDAFKNIGVPAIRRDTAARILAVTYVHGNNEQLVYNMKYLQDINHIEQVYHIQGSEVPDADLVVLVKKYVKELETFLENADNEPHNDAVFSNHAPDWAKELFSERYKITLIN